MTIEQFKSKRVLIFCAAFIATLFAGFGYSWSILQSAIMSAHEDWAASAIALTYTLQVACSCLAPIPFGGIIKRLTTKQNVMVGSILYGGGMVVCGFASQLWMLYVFYGVVAGVGVGFIYPQMMSYSVKVLPDKGSLASGLMAAAYGSGALIWAPVADKIIGATSVYMNFIILGIVFFVVIFCMTFFMAQVPDGYVEEMKASVAPKADAAKEEAPKAVRHVEDKNRGQMVKTATFLIMLIGFSFGLTSGMLVISQAKGIVVATCGDSLAAQAALCVSVVAAFNTIGRIFWGVVAQKIGNYNTMIAICVCSAIVMAALTILNIGVVIVLFMGLAAACFGGLATLLTPITADMFGMKFLTENFGTMYVAFAIAALIGPRVATAFPSYTTGYLVAIVLSVIGAVCGVILSATYKKGFEK